MTGSAPREAAGGGTPEPAGEGGAGAPLELRLDLPAAHSAARMARHLVRQFARSGGITGPELDNLVLVTSELLANAVDHGGGDSARVEEELERSVRMKLRLLVSEARWEIRVSDQGGGDPLEVDRLLHPEGPPDLEDERGRGFFLVAQAVDRLTVERSEDGLGLLLTAVREHGRSG